MTQINFASSQFHSKKEALHAGYSAFPTPAIVQEFQQSLGDEMFKKKNIMKKSELYGVNYTLQHETIQRFCQSISSRCTWKDYYDILHHLREAHETLDDLGAYDRNKVSIEDIQQRATLPPWKSRECEIISQPSPSLFYEYIQASRPFVVRGLARNWLALRKWSFSYLENLLNQLEVMAIPDPSTLPYRPASSSPSPSLSHIL
jgi:hypothetical protein